MLNIDYNSYQSTKTHNKRARFLVLHYTADNFKNSISSLTSTVSAHYLVPDPTDPTYKEAGFEDVRAFSLVAEADRAWHAGVSTWSGRTNLNDSSIGIEIVNSAREEKGEFIFPPYNPDQIEVVIELSRNILSRYPDIAPVNVVGHSDIAYTRKSDPGPRFPWKQFYDRGVGAWYDSRTVQRFKDKFCKEGIPERSALLGLFVRYGYSLAEARSDEGYRQLVRAFQLHFRPEKYDGEVDIETAAILSALVAKYFPQKEAVVA